MRLLKSVLLALLMLCPWMSEAQNVPAPQIGLSGNIGCIGFPCLNSGTYQMPSDANVTFGISNANTSGVAIKITSAVSLTATRTITYPNGTFFVGIENSTTGGQSLNISFGSGATCSVTSGVYVVMWFDGTNCVQSSSGGIAPGVYVETSPTATQKVTQPLGTQLGTNTFNATNYSYQSIDTFSDSIGQGTGATTFMQAGIKGQPVTWPGSPDYATATYSSGPTAYAYLLQADYGNAGHNYGRGGDASYDMAWHLAIWAHPTLQQNPVRSGQIGTNDNSLCGTNTNCQDTASKAELFSGAQATIPDTLKTMASSCTATGTWVTGDIAGSMVTTTSGSTLTCTSASSAAFSYIAYEKCDNTSGGTASVTVNGPAGTLEPTLNFFGLGGSAIFYGNQTSFATGSGQFSHCTLALARNGGVAGSNTTVITSTNTGRVEVLWVGGPYIAPINSMAPPLYVITGVPFENANAGQPGVGQYNTISQNAAITLAADGNNVLFADVQALMNTTVDFNGGTQATGDAVCGVNSPNGTPWAATWLSPLHPGDGGMCHIYEAIHSVLNPQPKGSQALQLWAGPYGLITGANSVGGEFGADSGMNGIPSASTLTVGTSGSFSSSAGIDFQVSDAAAVNPNYSLRYFSQDQYVAGESKVFGLLNETSGVFPWQVDADGDFCSQVATTEAGCIGSALFVKFGIPQVGVNSETPDTIGTATGVAGSFLNITNANMGTVNTHIVAQALNSGTQPEFHLVNMNAARGEWLYSVSTGGAFILQNCTLAVVSCIAPYSVSTSGTMTIPDLQVTDITVTGTCTGCGGGSSGFPITLGSTSIAASSTTTTVDGLTIGTTTPEPGHFTDLTAGASGNAQLAASSGGGGYSNFTFNGNNADDTRLGFVGGGSGDPNLYLDIPAGGSFNFRISNSTMMSLNTSGLSLSSLTPSQAVITDGSRILTSMPLAGSGTGLTTGPTITTAGHVVYFPSTDGRVADFGVLASSLATLDTTQTISGPKIFSTAPVVPTGSVGAGGTNASSQAYADASSAAANASLLAGTNNWTGPNIFKAGFSVDAESGFLAGVLGATELTDIDSTGMEGTFASAATWSISNPNGVAAFSQLRNLGTGTTCTVGSAAGAGATCSVSGGVLAGVITLNTGTATIGASTLLTIGYSTISTAPTGCSIQPRNSSAAGNIGMDYTTAPSTTAWTITEAVAPAAISSTFQWSYQCI